MKYEKKYTRTIPIILGTSSLRRTAQISRLHPHMKVHDIRGNLNTRLAKLDAVDSKYAGIVLAQAGLSRLGWQNRINHTIEPEEMLYAVGQGALAVECRASDRRILEMLQRLICHRTQCRVLAERSFLKTLGGGCSAPVAVHSNLFKLKKDHSDANDTGGDNLYELHVIGSVWSLDGKTEIQAASTCHLDIFEKTDLLVKQQNADDEGEVPEKKMKLTNKHVEPDELEFENPGPPKIIDHSEINFKTNESMRQDLQSFEINMRNVQANASSKCPYSSQTHTSLDGSSISKCPLDFEIGEDVMGQCPYFVSDTSQNHHISLRSCSRVNSTADSKSNTSGSSDATDSSTDIAKFNIHNTSVSNIDSSNTIEKEMKNDSNTVGQLFCGIYPHRCWPIKVFEQCEQLGEDLANKLIARGAISVMECAQKEIRNKI